MAFGQPSGPPAPARDVARLAELVERAGFASFKEARHPLGLTQRELADAIQVQEVRGEGVVGEQPVIAPGDSFRYTSGATLATPVGCMEGSYFMAVPEGPDFPDGLVQVPIPAFSLHTPTALH